MDATEAALRVLGLGRDTTEEEINQAYRDLAMVWHPDRFPSESRIRRKAEERFKKINEAYELLKRSDWRPGVRPSATGAGPSQSRQPTGTTDPIEPDKTRAQSKSSGARDPAHPIRRFGHRRRRSIYFLGALMATIPIAYLLYQSSNAHRFSSRTNNGASALQTRRTQTPTPPVAEQRPSYPTGAELLEKNRKDVAAAPESKQPVQTSGGHIVWDDEIKRPTGALRQPSNADTFTIGSHKNDVLTLQGTPSAIHRYPALGEEVWNYGFSTVKISIRNGCVTEWTNSGNLKVSLQPYNSGEN